MLRQLKETDIEVTAYSSLLLITKQLELLYQEKRWAKIKCLFKHVFKRFLLRK